MPEGQRISRLSRHRAMPKYQETERECQNCLAKSRHTMRWVKDLLFDRQPHRLDWQAAILFDQMAMQSGELVSAGAVVKFRADDWHCGADE